jgi:hypothetical protein
LGGPGLRGLGDQSESRRDYRIGARRVRLGRAEKRQMRTHRPKQRRGHAEHAAERIEGFERCARRSVIETGRAIVRKDRILWPDARCGADPFANGGRQTTCALRVGADNAKERLEESGRRRVRIDPPSLVFELQTHPTTADDLARSPVDRPAVVGASIGQVEDRLRN